MDEKKMIVIKTDDDFIVDGTSLSMMNNTSRAFVAEMTDNRELLLKLIHDNDWMIASAAADNPNIDSKTLGSLARDSNESVLVRIAVSQSGHVCEGTLKFLAKDDSPNVRWEVAHNKNATVEILALMMKDKNSLVRMAVAGHKNATVDILALMAKDKSPHVRRAVANNQNATVEILALIMKDKNSRVRQAIVRSMAKIMIENEGDNRKGDYAG